MRVVQKYIKDLKKGDVIAWLDGYFMITANAKELREESEDMREPVFMAPCKFIEETLNDTNADFKLLRDKTQVKGFLNLKYKLK